MSLNLIGRGDVQGLGGDGAPTAQTAEQMIAGMAALRGAPRLADVAETWRPSRPTGPRA